MKQALQQDGNNLQFTALTSTELKNFKNIVNEYYDNYNSSGSSSSSGINSQIDKNLIKNDPLLQNTINLIIKYIDNGALRVASKIDGRWVIYEWIKKAILMYFIINDNVTIDTNYTKFHDKLPLKFDKYSNDDIINSKIRIVPHAIVRYGAYIGSNTILMPSFINIGAYIGNNVMVDSWATVGSCAQIGNNVHLSGGAGIGGVLEPLQANPTIIEDNCFIGARSEIVEGVIVREGAVISMGVYIGKSTKIYNKLTKEITYGEIPPYSVVISGSILDESGLFSTYAAIIIKQVDENTRRKVAINELLRN